MGSGDAMTIKKKRKTAEDRRQADRRADFATIRRLGRYMAAKNKKGDRK